MSNHILAAATPILSFGTQPSASRISVAHAGDLARLPLASNPAPLRIQSLTTQSRTGSLAETILYGLSVSANTGHLACGATLVGGPSSCAVDAASASGLRCTADPTAAPVVPCVASSMCSADSPR